MDKLVVGGEVVLTGQEVAERMNVDDSRVRQLCIAGRLPGALKVAGRWFIPESGVEEYKKQKRVYEKQKGVKAKAADAEES